MKKNVFLIILLFMGFVSSASTRSTFYEDTLKCPVDDTVFVSLGLSAGYVSGTYSDFQMKTHPIYYQMVIKWCPKCGYLGFVEDFDTCFTAERRVEIKQFLAALDTADNYFEHTAKLKLFMGYPYGDVAYIYLLESYIFRKSDDIAQRKELQVKAKKYYIKAVNNNEQGTKKYPHTLYLIGEMYRRLGSFNLALEYYDEALKTPECTDKFTNRVEQMKLLAIKEDDDNMVLFK